MVIRLEAGTLADAITRAARIAPPRSSPVYEKCAGVLLELDREMLHITATDLACTYSHRIGILEADDEPFKVRASADILAGLMMNLPVSTGREIALEIDAGLRIDAGRTQTLVRTLPADDFPRVARFDEEGLVTVERFAQRVKQISWATDRKSPVLSGIFTDGEVLVACDGHRIAMVPCEMPVEKPVSAPLQPLTLVLKNVEDIQVRVTGRRFEIVPAEDVQLTSLLSQSAYPDARRVIPKSDALKWAIRFERDHFREALSRMLAFVKIENNPMMTLTFSESLINLDIVLPDVGELHDEIDCNDGPEAPYEMLFSPMMLSAILTNGARESMCIAMDGDAMHPVRFSDASGFEAWVMPMRKV